MGVQSAYKKEYFLAEQKRNAVNASTKTAFDFVESETYHYPVFLASTYSMLIEETQELCRRRLSP